MESDVIQRIKEICSTNGYSNNKLADMLGLGQKTVNNYMNGSRKVSFEFIDSVIRTFELDANWLISGHGKAFVKESPIVYKETYFDGAIPYYDNLPVSAGHLEMFPANEEPTGWVKLPGVIAQGLFPVIGCSMKPEVNPGDVVGISLLDSWELVDPDKIYLIITHEERMIKHLAIDEEDDSILWCISPNYPKFKISKSDIKHLYRISFCGKLM